MKIEGAVSCLVLTLCLSCGAPGPGAAAAKAGGTPPSQPYIWKNVEIVGGGFISGILFSPTQPDLIYARTDIGGAYRWNPRAKRWIPLTDWVGAADWNLLGIESIATDPKDARRVYLASGTYTNSWAGNGAILRSSDQGRTWVRTDMPFKLGGNEDGRSMGERLAVDPNDDRILYFGSRRNGLWRSDDFGAAWKPVDSFPIRGAGSGKAIAFVVFDARGGSRNSATSVAYIGVGSADDNLFATKDGGKTWQAVTGAPKGLWPHHGVLTSGGSLILTYGRGPGPNGVTDGSVWKYDTAGGVWTDITPAPPNKNGEGPFGYAGLAVDARRPDAIMVSTMDRWSAGDTLYRTTDGGKTWKDLKPGAVRDSSLSPFLNWGKPTADLGHWIGALALDPFRSGHVLYGTGATMWGSDDADGIDGGKPTHWTVRAQGIEETAVMDLISPPAGAHLLSALGDIGGFRHDDLTVSPRSGMRTNPTFNTTTGMDFAERAPEIVARVGHAGNGQKRGAWSSDGGTTWTPFGAEPEGLRNPGTIAVSADGAVFVWSPEGAAPHVSKDRGATWTKCQGLPNNVHVISDRVNPALFYSLAPVEQRLYVSEDGGSAFHSRTDGLIGGGRLRAVPGKEGFLWLAGTEHGLSYSENGGRTFVPHPSVQTASAIGFGKAAPGRDYPAVYLVGKVDGVLGVFRLDQKGPNWIRINDNGHQYGAIGQAVTGDPRIFGRVYLGTNGRGILYADPAPESSAASK